MAGFLAGAATSNITPPLGISLNGQMHDRTATHIHDELHARCLVLDDGTTRLGIAICDSCMLPGPVIEEAKHRAHEQCGLAMDRMLVAATHTHSAPTAAAVFQSEPNEEYAEFVALRIADGLQRAVNNLTPAKVGWGTVDDPTLVFNRRWRMRPGAIPPNPFGQQIDQVVMNPRPGSPDLLEPAGPTDPQISFLAVKGVDERPLALLANYALHYVGDIPTNYVSADYFGEFARRITLLLGAADLDPPFVGMLSNGTSANVNNTNFKTPGEARPTYGQLKFVANQAAERVAEAYKTTTFHDTARLDSREARLNLGRRLPTADEVQRAKFVLSQAKGPALTTLEQIYAHETVRMKDWPATVDVPLAALAIGELTIGAIPCEVFVETGLAIKAASPRKPVFIIELANDYCGYLPPPEHHQLGGYETWRARSSYLATDAEPKVRAKMLELIEGLGR